MQERIKPADATLRRDVLRFTAAAGVVLGAVAAVQLAALLLVLGPFGYVTLGTGVRGTSPLRHAAALLSVASTALLLVGSVRLLRGVRPGTRPLMLAYAATALAAGAVVLTVNLIALPAFASATTGPRTALRLAWLASTALGNFATQAVFPAVVLVVLLRLVPPRSDPGSARGFEVMPGVVERPAG